MKKFFAKASKPFAPRPAGTTTSAPPAPAHTAVPHSIGLVPKFILPPVPHPCPHDHISLLVTSDGLLLRPHILGDGHQPTTFVRVPWGKVTKPEEISSADEGSDTGLDWGESVIVYGIVGVLELFSASYLLVISSRIEVGDLFDPSRMIYGVKGVTAIPLTEERARIVVNTLASRNAGLSRPSLLPKANLESPTGLSETLDIDAGDGDLAGHNVDSPSGSQPRVQFSPNDEVKMMTPLTVQSFSMNGEPEQNLGVPSSRNSSSSDLSAASRVSSEFSVTTSPVARTVASRLSFWSRMSKRASTISPDPSRVVGESTETLGPGSLSEDQQALEQSMVEQTEEPAEVLQNILTTTAPPPTSAEEKHSELEDKIVRECVKEFTRGGMYFAYAFDITRSLQHKHDQIAKTHKQHDLLANLDALTTPEKEEDLKELNAAGKVHALSEPNSTLPLWRRVDKQYWWNEWISRPFVDAGLHSYVLPIIQGYYQIDKVNIPADPATHDDDVAMDYVVISRRSRNRAGLRYQRRGIDDEAHVANFVETESLMRVQRLGIENIFSYVQIRGSIPLFWTQSGNGLKPPPLLAQDRTHEQNIEVLRKHFGRTIPQYGPHIVLNLAEQSGKEGIISHGYRDYMTELNMPDAQYHEYDFHVETRGMKYENILKLIENMERTFEAQGYLWISDNTILSQQKGVFRINCIDCLDRTNVVQSAFARHVLNRQLGAVALLNPAVGGRREMDSVFNDLWANNGDAISRAYAGTSALKGDFTRTGKRDLSGLLNDGVNSLARMYTSTFSDWFCQAVIDFMLGNRTLSVFSEFLLKLQSTDPRDLIRLSKIRAEAIATSASRVLPPGENLMSGWTLFAPEELNVRVGERFEEKVLLLTTKALYIVTYDYSLEKVKVYTRVPLGDVIGISKGAYILSPLEEASRDPEQNAGFVITWLNSNQVTRVTSYSVRNSIEPDPSPPTVPPVVTRKTSLTIATRQGLQNLSRRGTVLSNMLTSGAALVASTDKMSAAFKVLPIDPARIRGGSTLKSTPYAEASEELNGATTCREAVDMIVECITRACGDVGGSHPGFVTEEDVVSLVDAQRMTTVYAKMEYGLKRLLWLGS